MRKQEILKSNSLEGSIGFISLLIVIEKYGSESISDINEALKLKIFEQNFKKKYNHKEISILSLIYHEVTHFLDLTTTLWGIEYFVRKSMFSVKKTSDSGDVFKLNYTELLMHEDLVKKYNKNIKLLNCIMNHHLEYNTKFGTYVNIIFKDHFSEKVETSINMLTLIESHAYCVESLIKIKYIESEPNRTEQIVLLKELDIEIEDFLNNPEYIEYNMFIVLAKKHFNYLTIKELFNFLHHLFIHVLDMDFHLIGKLIPYIEKSFTNTYLGNSIILDMRRGLSRHVIAFKLILFLYGFIDIAEDKIKRDLIKKLKNEPLTFIDDFYNYFQIDRYGISSDFQFDTIYNLFLEKNYEAFDYKFFKETVKHNRTNSHSIYELKNLNEYKLVDIFLNDYFSSISMPNRVDINIYEYDNSKEINEINNYVKDLKKFHIHPDDVLNFRRISS